MLRRLWTQAHPHRPQRLHSAPHLPSKCRSFEAGVRRAPLLTLQEQSFSRSPHRRTNLVNLAVVRSNLSPACRGPASSRTATAHFSRRRLAESGPHTRSPACQRHNRPTLATWPLHQATLLKCPVAWVPHTETTELGRTPGAQHILSGGDLHTRFTALRPSWRSTVGCDRCRGNRGNSSRRGPGVGGW